MDAETGIADSGHDAEQPGGIAESENQEAPPQAETAEEDGGKGAEDAQDNGGKPEEYELAAPDDFPLPPENLSAFQAKARELGLTKAQAEGMLNWHREFHLAATEYASRERKSAMDAWSAEMKADSEFGGTKSKATVAEARRALAEFDPDGSLRAMLRETGYQHHPAIIRAVARVGRALGEDKFVSGRGGSNAAALEDRLFANMKI